MRLSLAFAVRAAARRLLRMPRTALAVALAACIGVAGAVPADAQTAPTTKGDAPQPAPSITGDPLKIPDYRGNLRDIITGLSDYGKGRNARFLIITREGLGLTVKDQREMRMEALLHPNPDPRFPVAVTPIGSPHRRYVKAIDGVVMNDQYCVPTVDSTASAGFIRMLQDNGLVVLSVDHCDTNKMVTSALAEARKQGVLAHADTTPKGLDRVPFDPPAGENANNIDSLGDARNVLFLDGNAGYASKDDLVVALSLTNWDVIVLDAFHRDRTPLTPADVKILKQKKLGTRRLVISRMDIAHAKDTRYYWKKDWKIGDPEWIAGPVVAVPGEYDVKFWAPEWRAIIGKTFAALMDLGFDGVVIEGADAYKPLEARFPLN